MNLDNVFGTQVTSGLEGDDPENLSPAFNDVQQSVNLLVSKIKYVENDAPATYDPIITFDFDFQHLLDVFEFGLPYVPWSIRFPVIVAAAFQLMTQEQPNAKHRNIGR